MATAALVHYPKSTVVVKITYERRRGFDMAQRGKNLKPVAVIVTLALVGALLIGLATAGLVASAGAMGTAPAGLFNWLLAGRPDELPPAVAQPCLTALVTAGEGPRAAVLAPGENVAECGS
jgi:hypothetical protein